MIKDDPSSRLNNSIGYDAHDAFVCLRRDAEWRAASCPLRHREKLARCAGAEWMSALALLENRLGEGFTVALVGARGVGKTQMAVAMVSKAIENALRDEYMTESQRRTDWGTVALFCDLRDLFSDFKDTFDNPSRTERSTIEKYARPQLLVLDELTVRNESKWEHDTLLSIMNKRYNRMTDTIFIGNCEKSEIPEILGPSVASRVVETGGILSCRWPNFRSPISQPLRSHAS